MTKTESEDSWWQGEKIFFVGIHMTRGEATKAENVDAFVDSKLRRARKVMVAACCEARDDLQRVQQGT